MLVYTVIRHIYAIFTSYMSNKKSCKYYKHVICIRHVRVIYDYRLVIMSYMTTTHTYYPTWRYISVTWRFIFGGRYDKEITWNFVHSRKYDFSLIKTSFFYFNAISLLVSLVLFSKFLEKMKLIHLTQFVSTWVGGDNHKRFWQKCDNMFGKNVLLIAKLLIVLRQTIHAKLRQVLTIRLQIKKSIKK